jgi:hypothetical protein
MDQLKELTSRDNHKDLQHKDKLAETKRAERERKEAHKAELQKEKEKRGKEQEAAAALHKAERLYHGTSKRAAKDIREMAKRERSREAGQECEHGVWKCKICFPPNRQK